MRYVWSIFWAIVIFFGITFACSNAYTVSVDYYVNKATIALPLLLLWAVLLGTVLGLLAALPWWIRGHRDIRRYKHRIKEVEQEVTNLRAIPIRDSH